MSQSSATTARPRLRPIALPTEHGGWALLLEPALAGLIAAPTLAGFFLALAALGAFLARHPLTLALTDRRRRRRYPRTVLAERFALGYGLLALVALGLAWQLAPAPFWPALLAVAPLAIVQSAYELRRQSRAVPAELAGALTLLALAPAILLAAGRSPLAALILWGLLAGRAVPAVIYIRARLRRARGEAAAVWPALLTHALALVVALLLILNGPGLWLAVAAMTVLLLRALIGLRPQASAPRAVIIGIQEAFIGIFTALLFGLAMR